MAEDEVELEDWMEDSSDDPETDQLIDLLDGVDSDILFDTVNRNDIVVMDLLQQNGIEIDDEVVNAKNKDGFSVLHLAARNGLNSFCDYLLQQNASVNLLDSYGNTALHWAVYSSDNWLLVDALIIAGATVDVINQYHQTPFLLGCSLGRISSVQSLVLQGANLYEKDNDGDTGLHLAALGGHLKVAKFLLRQEESIDVNSTNNKLQTPLHLIATLPDKQVNIANSFIKLFDKKNLNLKAKDYKGRTALFYCIDSNRNEMFDNFLGEGFNPESSDNFGRHPIHYAAYFHNENILTMLLQEQVDVNCKDNDGCTPLHAGVSSESIINLLLECGGDVTILNNSKHSPLHYALIGGYEESFITMMQYAHGIEVNEIDFKGRSLIHYSTRYNLKQSLGLLRELGSDDSKKDKDGNSIIHYAANFGSIDLMKDIFSNARKHKLSSYITGPNCASQKPLHLAAARGDAETCRFLLDNRAPSWAPDRYGTTALHYSALFHNHDTVEILSELRDINRKDKAGAGVLHYAALGGDTVIFDQLLNSGARLQDKDNQGRSPLFYSSNFEMINYLQNRGLNIDIKDKLGRNMLFTSMQLHQSDIFHYLVNEYNMSLESRDKDKITLLHHAAYCGNVELVRYLLENTTLDPFIIDSQNRTPIYFAAAAGKNDCLIALLQYLNGDCQIRIVDQRDIKGRSPLDAAAFGGFKDCVFTLTERMHPDEYYAPALDGRTPLHVAVNNILDNPDEELLLRLLQYFDIDAADKKGRTSLHRTVYHNLPGYTEFLLSNGCNVNIQDKKGITVVMMAVYLEHEEMLALLEEYNPDLSLKDNKGNTAADYKEKRDKENESDEYEDYDEYEEPPKITSKSKEKESIKEEEEKQEQKKEEKKDEEEKSAISDISKEDQLAILKACDDTSKTSTSNDITPGNTTTTEGDTNTETETPTGNEISINQSTRIPTSTTLLIGFTVSICILASFVWVMRRR